MRTTYRLLSAAATVALAAGALTTTTVTGADAAVHAPSHRATPYDVTIKASTTELVKGKKITIRGHVTPKAAGQTVVLQQKFAGKPWKSTGTGTLTKRGRYEITDKPTTMNARKYRVVKAASGSHSKGISPTVSVTLYQWHGIPTLQLRQSSGFSYTDTLTMNTVDYPSSYYGFTTAGHLDLNLERQCIKLDATYGMSDDADTGSSATIEVHGDTTQLYTGTFTLQQSAHSVVDLHDVFRLAFDYDTVGQAHAIPGIGSPKVLCSF